MSPKNTITNFFNDTQAISYLYNKKDLPTKFTFANEFSDRIEILINQEINTPYKNIYGDKITFNLKFFKNTGLVDISEMTELSLSTLLKQYSRFVDEHSSSNNIQQAKAKLRNNLTRLFKPNTNIFKNDIITKFFVAPRYVFDVYTVECFNEKPVSRTIVNSLDRINIINSEFMDKAILLEFHKNNMLLVNYTIQNNFSLLSKSISLSSRIMIGFFRFWTLFGGIIGNMAILALQGHFVEINNTNINEIYSSITNFINLNRDFIYGIATSQLPNILFSLATAAFWFATPRLIRYFLFRKKFNFPKKNKKQKIKPT